MAKLGLDVLLPVSSWPDVHAVCSPVPPSPSPALFRNSLPFQVRELKTEIKKLKKDLAVSKPLPFADLKKCASHVVVI